MTSEDIEKMVQARIARLLSGEQLETLERREGMVPPPDPARDNANRAATAQVEAMREEDE